MGHHRISFCLRLGAIYFALALGGCLTIPNSPTPRFYALTVADDNQLSNKMDIKPGMIIGVGPVRIPEYQNRPQMVTITQDKMIQLAQFDRWGESLDMGLARLMREDLTVMLPKSKLTLYPWNPSVAVKYQVIVEIVQLDSDLHHDMLLVVQWIIVDVEKSKSVMMKRFIFHQPIAPQNYAGMAKTLSTACASLSRQMATALATLKTT